MLKCMFHYYNLPLNTLISLRIMQFCIVYVKELKEQLHVRSCIVHLIDVDRGGCSDSGPKQTPGMGP